MVDKAQNRYAYLSTSEKYSLKVSRWTNNIHKHVLNIIMESRCFKMILFCLLMFNSQEF